MSMAAGQAGVSGSQFFLTLAAEPDLKSGGFSAFGRVTDGLNVLQALTTRDPQQPGQPPGDRIINVEIIESEN
jgi:cyclophilin family peptidyl-prolyl cis-trans isomerase